MASFSDATENKIIDHVNGKTSFTMPTTVALALCTTVPTDASTGATIVEATGATGYARLTIAAGSFSAASSGEAHNSGTLTFAAITAGTATVIGFAVCDSATTGAGNVLYWGTCTSTVISSTQTPPTIAASALSLTLD